MIVEEVLVNNGYLVWETRSYPDCKLSSESRIAKGLFDYFSYLYQEKPNEEHLKHDYFVQYDGLDPKEFQVPSWDDYCKNRVAEYYEAVNALRDFFGNKLEDFKRYIESIGVLGKIGVVGAVKIVNPNLACKYVYAPDFVAKKNDDIYIIEVKTNNAIKYFKEEKLEGLTSVRKFGLVPLIITLKVDIVAKDFLIKELSP